MKFASLVTARLSAFAFIALTTCFNAQADELYDVAKFELTGIQLGMTAEEAVEKSAKYHSINPEDFETELFHDDFDGPIAKDAVAALFYESDSLFIEINLEPVIENDYKNYTVVSEIVISPRGGSRSEREARLAEWREELTKDYGSPSFIVKNDDGSLRYLSGWCDQLNRKGDRCAISEAQLQFTASQVRFYEPEYVEKSLEAYVKWRRR